MREIRRTGARTPAELKRFWKDRDKAMREGDRRGTKAYMDRMDAPTPRKNPTKAQKREKAKKASVKTRVANALAKFLHQANPAMKTAGATVTRLKGGGFTIRPIKANPGGKGKGPYYVGNYGPIKTLKEAKAIAAMLRRQGDKSARVNTW
jgi:hypothetical protein